MNIQNALNGLWAIVPERLSNFHDVMDAHLKGPKLNLKDMEARIVDYSGRTRVPMPKIENGVATIEIMGPVMQRPDIFDRVFFGAESVDTLKSELLALLSSDAVTTILLHIDSPGGQVGGVQEFSNLIYEARKKKSVIAYSDGMIASAAYWIASAAEKIYLSSESVFVGSIGVIHSSMSAAQQGLTVYQSGKMKSVPPVDSRRMSDDLPRFNSIQDQVDYIASVFIGAVAKGRGVSYEKAEEMAGEARLYLGQQAIEIGLVDGYMAIGDIIAGAVNISTGGGALPVQIKSEGDQDMEITLDKLKAENPEIYNSIVAEGKAAAEKEAEDKKAEIEKGAFMAGVAAENERVKAVKAQAMPGHETLIEALMLDGKTTGEQAAMAIIKAEQDKRAGVLAAMQSGAPQPVADVPAPDPAASADDDSRPVEEVAKEEFEKSADLRSEFQTVDRYVAFKRAHRAGLVRIKQVR